ncbi:hypothetical protein BD309DRAFT_1018837 [Dichomitus squalens]|uniref:Uncharacterized protein n=1 Tax=Dichomitus squalens TaxID=114155 RepID=A0A4Q9NR57_9APHY|nr:hypothetical protein BD309DRAFT_1018837 [Dichomitus squalens]TBU53694.1 hypothetical protein BD310DRAFT_980921 [Dichomitus squalens]
MEYPASILTQDLLTFAPGRSMQVWAIGCRLMLEEVARAGAERMLHYRDLGSYTHLHQFVPIAEFIRHADARGVSAADYCRLSIYHSQRGEVEPGFTFTRPLPRQTQERQLSGPTGGDAGIPWAFFTSVVLPDITCSASDGRTFPAHKGLLNAPQQSVSTLNFAEQSPILAHLLRLCYLGDAPLPQDHHLFLAVLKAAEKYDMTRIVDLLVAKWESVSAVHPASLYFAALHYGFPELARIAARRVPRCSHKLYVPEMELAPAIQWQRLSDYWEGAATAVDRVHHATSKVWRSEAALAPLESQSPQPQKEKQRQKSSTSPLHPRGLPCHVGCETRGPEWVQQRRDDVVAELRQRPSAQNMPSAEELFQRSVAPTLSEKPWCPCCFNIAQDLVRMGTTFRQGMRLALDEVPLVA